MGWAWQLNKIINQFSKMRKNNSFCLYSNQDEELPEELRPIEKSLNQPNPALRRYRPNGSFNIEQIQLSEQRNQEAALRDSRYSRKELKPMKEPEPRMQSPKIRGFLRHTTYVAKGGSWFDSLNEKDELMESCHSATLIPSSMKKKPSQYGGCHNDHNTPSTTFIPHLKTDNFDLDGVATKVKRTASFIEELKKMQLENRWSAKQEPKGHAHSSRTYETEIRSEISTKAKRTSEWKYEEDLGFKRRLYEDYYTPKPETSATVEIAENMEKMKRGYTPNIKKIVSPSHKKYQDKPMIEDFMIEKKLGGGRFGTVYKVQHNKTRAIYALKKVEKKILKDNMFIEQFIQEVKIQSHMKHQNVMELYSVFDDAEHVYMLMEYMPDGNLFSLLKKKTKFSEKQASEIVKQIAKGLIYMQDLGIAHRDLKPENVVISNGVYKICDFGWAAICRDRRKTYCGTFDYTAPQLFEGEEYDLSVDLWGLGVITYELLVGKPPFYHISKKMSMEHAMNVQSKKISFPVHVSPAAVSFIESLLRRNPAHRLQCDQILKHPFLEQVKEPEF